MNLFFQLHITGKCNLRCKHCYIDKHASELSFEEIEEIFSQYDDLVLQLEKILGEKVVPHLQLTGGEPLIHPDFKKVLRLIKNKNYRVGFMSNGSFLDDETLSLLKELDLRFFQLSLDGVRKTHDALRSKGDFQRILKSMAKLKSYDLPLHVSFTAHSGNFREFSKVARVCRKNKVDLLWSDRYVPFENSSIKPLSTEETKQYVEILKKEKENPKNKKAGLIIRNQRALQFYGSDDTPYMCAAGQSFITVDEYGNFMPCRRMPIYCGNFREHKMKDVFLHNGVFCELRRHNLSGKCLHCEHKEKCLGGAHCMAYAVNKDFHMPDPNCFIK